MVDLTTKLAVLTKDLNLTDEQLAIITANLSDLSTLAIFATEEQIIRDGTHLTRGGFELLGKALAGKPLKYTRVQFGDSINGDGEFVKPTREEQYEFTELIGGKDFELPIADCRFGGGGTAIVSFKVANKNLAQGFWYRELGLFAEDPDTGEEILYAYRNTGLLSEWVPAGDSSDVWDVIMAVVTVVDEAKNVTAIIDASLAFVSQAEFSEHINSRYPHPNAPSLGEEISTTLYFWANDEDINLHPISTENVRKLILGGDAADLPRIDRRVTQLEVNVANVYMQLNAERELGLEPNLLLMEDFGDNSACDLYSCRVIAQAAGISEVELENDYGILCGHWYTITDTLQYEYVQVKSIAKNGGKVIVLFEQILNNTYNLDNTYLMRTTTYIANGRAYGAGDLRGKTYPINESWQGLGGGTTETLILNTTQQNIDAFEISGNYAFTAAGEFTLTDFVPYVFDNNNVRSATGVTVNAQVGDFGTFTKDFTVATVPGTEFYTALVSLTATQENSTLVGNSRANTFIVAGGQSNVLVGGLGSDTFIFESGGGLITDFGVGANTDPNSKSYATKTTQTATSTYYAYNRTDSTTYSNGIDALKVDGTVTAISFSGHGNDNSKDNQTFSPTIHYTHSDGNNYSITLGAVVKKNNKKVYQTDDVAAKSLKIFDTSSGTSQSIASSALTALFTN